LPHGPGHHLAAGGSDSWTATADVAHLLFRDYVLPFEVVSVLLTARRWGVYLARREPKPALRRIGRETRSARRLVLCLLFAIGSSASCLPPQPISMLMRSADDQAPST